MARGRAPRLDIDTMEDEDEDVRQAIDRVDPKKGDVLDRSKPFGQHFPPWNGAHFQQADKFGIQRHYDNMGQRVRIGGEPEDGARPVKAATHGPRVAMAPRRAPEPVTEEREPGEPVLVGDVNLTAWMLRQEKYAWSAVRKAIAERFSKECTHEADAFDFLIHEKVVTVEQLRAAGVTLSADK